MYVLTIYIFKLIVMILILKKRPDKEITDIHNMLTMESSLNQLFSNELFHDNRVSYYTYIIYNLSYYNYTITKNNKILHQHI